VRFESKPKKNSYLRTTPLYAACVAWGRKILPFLSYHFVHEPRSTFSLESPAKLHENSIIMLARTVAIIVQEYSAYFKTCCNLLLPQKREGFCCGFMRFKKNFVPFCNGVRPGTSQSTHSVLSLLILDRSHTHSWAREKGYFSFFVFRKAVETHWLTGIREVLTWSDPWNSGSQNRAPPDERVGTTRHAA